MEISSKFVECGMNTVSAPSFNSSERARELVKDIAGHCWRGRGDVIDRVFDQLRATFPASHWTRRRVRAFLHREAARIDWREVRELEFVAEVERVKRLEEEAARTAHNEFLAYISTTLDRMGHTDEAFYQEHRRALRALALGAADQKGGATAGQGRAAASLGGSRVAEAR